ncbi:MAG TPA: thiamine phosphate synthase, partial [Tepidisphaeraceae bacterium]
MNGEVLRILDANANRAREGLRVVEDYARFVRDDEGLCGELKEIRHALREAMGNLLRDAVLWRDTPGDVGTGIKTGAELAREDVGDVVTAAGKRVGEALRTLEEYLKVEGSELRIQGSAQIEAARYRFYEVEKKIALTLRPAGRFDRVRLYVLITESACRLDWFEAATQAIEGGADCLQLREKDLEGGELLARAKRMVKLCRERGVISIINDRPDIAVLSGADGVHVGQGDLPATEVRKI